MGLLHYQRHVLKYKRATSATTVNIGNTSWAVIKQIVKGLHLVGALGGSHGDGRRNDVGDVVGLIVDAERGRSNGHR